MYEMIFLYVNTIFKEKSIIKSIIGVGGGRGDRLTTAPTTTTTARPRGPTTTPTTSWPREGVI